MIDTIEVTINGKKHQYSKGITLQEIYGDFQDKYQYPILIARVDNRWRELTHKLEENCTVEFLDLTSSEGNRVHIYGLTFILIYAIKRLFGKDADVIVQHSVDKGVLFQSTFKLNEEKVERIKAEMKEIIKRDLPFTKVTIDRIEAINYFEEIGDIVKAKVLRYSMDNYVTLYRLGNIYNTFYNPMPISTGKLPDFDLSYIKDNSFSLRFPTVYIPDKIKKYQHHPKLFEIYEFYKMWGKVMQVQNAADLNRIVSSGKIGDLIKIDETAQGYRLLDIGKSIYERKDKVKIVLIAGPSSAGKTTTSRKLSMFLECFGMHPKALSMDDYFLDRKDCPKDENGEYDFECLDAVDLKLFDKQVGELLKGEEVTIPTFNFVYGVKEYKKTMKLEEDDILIIEGIHALDTKVLTNIPREKKYKIYISPLTEINLDNHNRIATTDNRLLRRIVRDNRTRNYKVEDTISSWGKVRRGEELYIFPYQDESDAIINSAAMYEIGVLKTYAEPLLYAVDPKSPYYEEAKRLLKILRLFLPIPSDSIPEDAVLREFIGGSYFHE